MFRWIIVCAITAMSAGVADQARAQAANPEPGYCAQFYPNSDCNSIGPATPGAVAPSPESEPEEAAAPPPPAPKKAAKKQAEKNKKPQTSATVAPPK
jgi:hypothetical protein